MKRTGLILLVLICLPISFLAIKKLQSRRPSIASSCPDGILSQAQSSTDYIHPEKVVVEPWQGRHNVFATFKIPNGYQPSSVFVVTLKGSHPYCGTVVPQSNSQGDRQAVGKFRTRTTLWLMSKGQMDELEQPSNWKLMIFK